MKCIIILDMFGSYEDKDYQDALVASVGVEVGVVEGVLGDPGGDGLQLDLALVSLADDLVVASARKLEAFCYF